MHNVKKFILSLFVLSQVGTAAHAQKVGTLLTKKLPEAPGQEIQVIAGNYAPGAGDASHRHDAHVVAYVLEGKLRCKFGEAGFSGYGPCFLKKDGRRSGSRLFEQTFYKRNCVLNSN